MDEARKYKVSLLFNIAYIHRLKAHLLLLRFRRKVQVSEILIRMLKYVNIN